MSVNPPINESEPLVAASTQTDQPEIVPVAAVLMRYTPNREQRNTILTEVGTMTTSQGTLRLYANRTNGSLLIVMPNNKQSYMIDSAIAANQCYKYWLLTSGSAQESEEEVIEADEIPVIYDQFGKPIEPAQA